mmetsp:Transcript_1233/g.4278  ORF Transcript_1233/g.4278 Transcript_1233/m.4278 type:complete len:219 (-) Transcript_1233:195-851(-)
MLRRRSWALARPGPGRLCEGFGRRGSRSADGIRCLPPSRPPRQDRGRGGSVGRGNVEHPLRREPSDARRVLRGGSQPRHEGSLERPPLGRRERPEVPAFPVRTAKRWNRVCIHPPSGVLHLVSAPVEAGSHRGGRDLCRWRRNRQARHLAVPRPPEDDRPLPVLRRLSRRHLRAGVLVQHAQVEHEAAQENREGEREVHEGARERDADNLWPDVQIVM